MNKRLLGACVAAAAVLTGCGGSPAARPAAPPVATTSPTTTTTSATKPGVGKPPVTLGDMNTPEQFILGALYSSALSGQGYTVEVTRNIGTVPIRSQALMQGSLDIYPEYLNLWDSQVAGNNTHFKTLQAALAAGRRFAAAHKLALLNPTPFGDEDGVATLSPFAAAHHIRTLNDLKRIPRLQFGAPLEFSTGNAGLSALERVYKFHPAHVTELNVGTQYKALRDGVVQAAWVTTTDGQLSQSTYRLLSDPHRVTGFGNVVLAVSQKALAQEGPAFTATLNHLNSLLTPTVMAGLNAEVELGNHDPKLVAREFLQGNGILPPPAWSTQTTTTTTPTTTTPGKRVSGRLNRNHPHRAPKRRAR